MKVYLKEEDIENIENFSILADKAFSFWNNEEDDIYADFYNFSFVD